jgi:hypothetical protein
MCASRPWSLPLAAPDIYLQSPTFRSSQKIEFVFAASPETIRSEALGGLLSLAQSAIRRTWQPARCVIFFSWSAVLGCGRASLFRWHKGSARAINREQVRHHLSGYGEGPAIRIPFLLLFLINPAPAHDFVWDQAWRPRSIHAGCACCASWKSAFGGLSLLSSSRLHTARNN